MTDIHIDDFYKDTAIIFIRLFSNFPRKVILYVDDVSGPDSPDEFGLHSPRFIACFSAMVWLAEQGYINYETPIKQEALDQAVLNHKGFMLLSSRSELNVGDDQMEDTIPTSVMEESLSNITQLRKAVAAGSSIMIRQCVQSLLSK